MKPITAKIKEKGGAVTYPVNQEVTLNADGSGGPIYNSQESSCGCDKSPAKKIGLQGLGAKGNKGYSIGSPAKCWSGYKRVPGTKKGAKGSCKKK